MGEMGEMGEIEECKTTYMKQKDNNINGIGYHKINFVRIYTSKVPQNQNVLIISRLGDVSSFPPK